MVEIYEEIFSQSSIIDNFFKKELFRYNFFSDICFFIDDEIFDLLRIELNIIFIEN